MPRLACALEKRRWQAQPQLGLRKIERRRLSADSNAIHQGTAAAARDRRPHTLIAEWLICGRLRIPVNGQRGIWGIQTASAVSARQVGPLCNNSRMCTARERRAHNAVLLLTGKEA